MARLTIISGKRSGDFHLLTQRGLSIGRLAANDVFIPDEQVSRQHAKVELRGEKYFLIDLGSSNGTLVNGEKVAERELAAGDVITVGRHEVRFEDETSSRVIFKDGGPVIPGSGTIVKTVDELSALRSGLHLRTLYELGKALLSKAEVPELLSLVMDMVFKELPAQRGFLLLLDEKGQLTPSIVRTCEPGHEGGVTISRTITEKVLNDKVGVLTADAATDPRFSAGESVIVYGIRSALCVPLWNGDDIIGVIYIDTKTDKYSFTEDDLDLLTAMANQAAIGIQKAQLAEKARRESELRSRLARYHSPDVVEHIMRGGAEDEGALPVAEKEVTVLFSDIKGFTSIAETLKPAEVARLLNEYFTAMTDILFEFGGTLDKYIGDAIMALFGAPFGREDDAVRAVRAALRMQEALASLSKGKKGGVRFSVRIGINTGAVVAGNIGSPRRMDYTVIGDAVNVAQRLESIAKPGQILIGGATYEKVKGNFLLSEIGRQRVKGKDKEVIVYEVLG